MTHLAHPYIPKVSDKTAQWSFDASAGAYINVLDDGTATIFGNANNFAGMFIVYDASNGHQAIFLTSGANMNIVGQDGGTYFTTTATTDNKVNVYLATGVVTLENKSGGAANFRIVSLRMHTAN